MSTKYKTIAIPPGKTIMEQLEDRGMSVGEFADRMEISPEEADRLLMGEIPVTQDLMERLEDVLEIPARFWARLEEIYERKLDMIEREENGEER